MGTSKSDLSKEFDGVEGLRMIPFSGDGDCQLGRMVGFITFSLLQLE